MLNFFNATENSYFPNYASARLCDNYDVIESATIFQQQKNFRTSLLTSTSL